MIRPTVVHPDGSFDFVLDELGHTGTIVAAAIQFARTPSGGLDFRGLVVACPDGCGSVTYHPLTGDGSIRQLIQAVFLAKGLRSGCACGALTAGRPAALVRSHLSSHAQQLGGTFIA